MSYLKEYMPWKFDKIVRDAAVSLSSTKKVIPKFSFLDTFMSTSDLTSPDFSLKILLKKVQRLS